jgi:subtilisin family serine protease
MVVVNSAGNEGGSMWTCVSTPSDGDNVLSIAAVDSNGVRAGFSSVGVDTNGRVKPNIAAMGENAVVFWVDNNITRASGTSFSCPITSGMIACLWQAHPEATPAEIYRAVERSGNQFSNPDSLLGYGIPDYNAAMTVLSTPSRSLETKVTAFPNPFKDSFTLSFSTKVAEPVILNVFDAMGRMVFSNSYTDCHAGENSVNSGNLSHLVKGLYFLKIEGKSFSGSVRVVKE